MMTPLDSRSGNPAFHVKRLRFATLRVLALAVLVTLASGCAVTSRDIVTGKKRGFGYSWEQQVQIGRESDPQIVSQFGKYDQRTLDTYVDGIGQRLLAVSHLRRAETSAEVRNTRFTFRVLDSPVVNAFALPGGYIYVTRGLLAHVENEAQLAVVIGHEIAHVARQHSARQAFEAQRSQLGLIAGAVVGQAVLGGNTAENVLNIGGQGLQLLQLKYGRDDETEADQLGVEYATLAGYRAEEGSDFFNSLKRLSQQGGSTLPEFLSTHPDPGNREVRVRQLAQEWASRAPTPPTAVREAEYDAQIDGIVFDENPRQGFVENGTFYHPDLRFQFTVPQGWQLQNDAAQVLLGPQGGGAIAQMTISNQPSAEAAARAASAQQGATLVNSGATTINGLSAYQVVIDGQTQQGVIRAAYVFIEYNGAVYQLAGQSTQQGFSQFQNAFSQFFGSFRALTDSRILAVQPVRLSLRDVTRAATFRSLLPSNLPAGVTADELAIVNQTTLDAQVPAGTRIKTIQR